MRLGATLGSNGGRDTTNSTQSAACLTCDPLSLTISWSASGPRVVRLEGLSMSNKHEGGCVCGSVRYVITGEPLRATVCHCTWCQRRTGSAFSVESAFNEEQVKITGGPLTKYRHISDESGRWLDLEFCPKCGTNIGFTLEWRPGIRVIDAGTLDDPSWINADVCQMRYTFLRSAQRWSEVPDGADRYERHVAT